LLLKQYNYPWRCLGASSFDAKTVINPVLQQISKENAGETLLLYIKAYGL
jgi:hypothetical protein